ncbi:hypothetical protein POJ06DRAFT_279694 [Lipomyces tetrasporus]|uniref:Uncharacterized protein n=1 Tax=Lipomyces tetrasporus TaxID=54092 RepID=A0AAD7VWN1_9ASCO|nr:uncharacterized protein POJ06DRAFT_279694 [Lipomyces tetrasporus]KAJ8104199.1 hypothetical protein POJ06DRAFT_279694 [Lipomyces tetrasporus]
MSMLLNVGASVTNTFGPLILNGLGYDKYTTSLLNMPFAAIQLLVILLASYLAQKAHVKRALIAGYYLLAFLFGGNPLIVTWIVGNTAGTTKKSTIMKRRSHLSPGLRACLGMFIALVAVVLIELANLVFLNKLQERKRVKNGKQAKMVDPSMQDHYHSLEEENVEAQNRLGDNAFLDLTDRENDEFVYIY